MARRFLRVDVLDLLPRLRAELTALLGSLSRQEWSAPTSCPGWTVHDIAAHLLGVELGNVSVRRDSWQLGPAAGQDFGGWLDGFNRQWVQAAERISPALLTDLIGQCSRQFEELVATLDLAAMGGSVGWATGSEPAPVWLDVAREYMERFVHQSQIRDATGRPALPRELAEPVLRTAVHCLPRALASTRRPPGTVLAFIVDEDPATTWFLTQGRENWELGRSAPDGAPACEVRTTLPGAIRLFVRDPGAPALVTRGDGELAAAISRAKAILGS